MASNGIVSSQSILEVAYNDDALTKKVTTHHNSASFLVMEWRQCSFIFSIQFYDTSKDRSYHQYTILISYRKKSEKIKYKKIDN